MTITHHLDQATVLAYAAGTLSPALKLVVQSHLELCSQCRGAVLAANEVGGELLGSEPAAEVSDAVKRSVMQRLGTATLHRLPLAAAEANEVPRALRSVIGGDDLDSLKWQRAGRGVSMVRLQPNEDGSGFLGLLRISPGSKMPDHGHGGTELTLVLRGAYQDELGQFGRGDIADLDESVAHTPVVSAEHECICLVANDAPTRFRSWPARLVQRFIGI